MSDVTPLRRMLRLVSQSFRRGRRAARRAPAPRSRPRVEALEDRTLPATVTWISSVSGAWDVGSNWSTGKKPGAADDVVISSSSITVTHSTGTDAVHSVTSNGTLELSGGTLSLSAASTLNAFKLGGGTLAGSGAVTVGGVLTWTAGTLSGTGKVEANGGMQISGTGGHTLTGLTLDNAAEADWTGTGGISLGANATLNNLSTGTFYATADATLSGSASTFNNAGTFSKTGGSGTTTISVSLNNTGTVDAASGTLNVAGKDVATGAFTVETGATLAFNGGTQALKAGSSVSGAGDVKFGGATVTVLGSYSITGNTTVSGGTVQFDTDTTLPTLTLSGGTLGGTATVTVTGALTWTGGTMNGGGTTVANGGTTISGTNFKQLSNRTFDNAGTATWSGTGILYMNSNSVWNNLANASLLIENDAQLGGGNGSQYTGSKFNNAGTLQKMGGTGTTTVLAFVNNTGTIDAASGTLNLAGGGRNDAAYTVESGATLGLTGGSHALDANSSITGDGSVSFSGGTVDLSGAYTVTGTTTVSAGTVTFAQPVTLGALTVSGGTLTVDGDLTVSGLLTWTGGTMNGSGTTFAQGDISISGNNGKALAGRTLENAGTATWTGTSGITLSNNAVVTNDAGALFDARSDVAISGYSGTFNNAGTLKKSAGTGTTTINALFNNSGAVEAASGTLSFPAGGLDGGSFTADSGAALLFGGGEHSFTAASSVGGDGSVTFGGASVTFAGTYSVGGPTTISNGTVAFDSAVTLGSLTLSGGTLAGLGDVSVTGLLTWTGGTMTGAGQTDANGGMTISGTGTKNLLNGRTLNGSETTTWSGGDINVMYDAVWNNLSGAVMDVRGNNRFGTDSVFHAEGTFNNYGTFQKSAGTGVTYGDIAFNNSGTVEAASGTLDLAGGGISSGAFAADSGATLEFGGGPHYLTATSTVSGDGTVIFDSETFNGLSMTIAGSYNVAGTTTFQASNSPFAFPPVEFDTDATMGTLNLTAGTLTGPGDVTVTDAFNWTGGTLSGLGKLIVTGTTTLSGSNSRTLDTRTLQNAGTATWTGTGGVSFANDAVWNNGSGATLDVQSTGAFSGSGTFYNVGSVTKTTGTGTAAISVAFYNQGSVDVETGRLNFGAGVTNTGTVTLGSSSVTLGVGGSYLQNDGTTSLNGGTLLATAVDIEGGVLSGPGTVGASTALATIINAAQINVGGAGVTGTLTINGNYTQTAAGTLVIQVGGSTPGTDTDKLAVTGQATLDGSLTVKLLNGFVSGPLQVVTYGSRSGTFASLDGDGSQYTATYGTGGVTLN
jgi:fibronectin-binding autotransporter adhesin